MPGQLVYPIKPEAPTIAYQLITDSALGSPRVAETPTIGYPFELTLLEVGSSPTPGQSIEFSLLLATNPYVSGNPIDGYLLHQIKGGGVGNSFTTMKYFAGKPLTLRPRIQVAQAGYRIRLAQQGAAGLPDIRVLLVLTPTG